MARKKVTVRHDPTANKPYKVCAGGCPHPAGVFEYEVLGAKDAADAKRMVGLYLKAKVADVPDLATSDPDLAVKLLDALNRVKRVTNG
jgi:hypothetical protein